VDAAGEEFDEVERRLVSPVDVFERHDDRRCACVTRQSVQHRRKKLRTVHIIHA
jgi:hypothetical protein